MRCAARVLAARVGLALAVSMLGAAVACRSAGEARLAPTHAAGPPCDTAALEAKGDLDGLVDAVQACGDRASPAQLGLELDALVTLGEVASAKRRAAWVLSREAGEPHASRARAILDAPDPPTRARSELLREARALVVKARTEREPARWVELAKAKHAFMRATGANAERRLLVRGDDGAMAIDHPLWTVKALAVPPTVADALDADAITELDPRTGELRAIGLVHPPSNLDNVVALPALGPSAFAVQTTAGIRVRFAETGTEAPTLEYAGTLTASPRGDVLIVHSSEGATAIDVRTWQPRWTVRRPLHDVRVVDESVVSPGDAATGSNLVVDLATGAIVVDVMGLGAVSPSGESLVVLEATEPGRDGASMARTQRLRVYQLGGKREERTLEIPRTASDVVEFASETEVRVKRYAATFGECARTLVAFDLRADAGRVVPIEGPDPCVVTAGPTASGLLAVAGPARPRGARCLA